MLGPHECDDNLRALKHRIATFKDVWPFLEDCNCTPEKVFFFRISNLFFDSSPLHFFKMAEAGFYHVGSDSEPDLVRCYYCRRELDGWEPTDVPWDEHKRRECPFISLGKVPQNLTLEDTFDLEAARKCIIVVRIG